MCIEHGMAKKTKHSKQWNVNSKGVAVVKEPAVEETTTEVSSKRLDKVIERLQRQNTRAEADLVAATELVAELTEEATELAALRATVTAEPE